MKKLNKMALTTLPQAEQIPCFPRHFAPVAASPSPILFGDQSAKHESCGCVSSLIA
jgi:hypothetical protein